MSLEHFRAVCHPTRVQFKIPSGIVDLAQRTVVLDQRTSELSVIESELLTTLLEANGATVEMETLLQRVWKANPKVNSRAPAFAVYRLRSKIELDPSHPRVLFTDHGRGFRLQPYDDPTAHRSVGPSLKFRNAFVGREQALQTLNAAHPLTVITGPPGVGKTRLVDHFLKTSQKTYHWFNLEDDASDPRIWNEALAATVQVVVFDGADGHTPALRQWWEDIREHVHFQLILTRAAPLGARGERVLDLHVLGPAEAKTLFQKRTEEHGFPFDGAALPALLSALDHLPLAIELCALRTEKFSPASQLELLQQGALPVSRGTDRHASLTAALQHHLRHLSAEDLDTLERLAFFPGGIAEDDALANCTSEQLAAIERLGAHRLIDFDFDGRIRVPRWIRSAILGYLPIKRRQLIERQRMEWIERALHGASHPDVWLQGEIVNLFTICRTSAVSSEFARKIARFAKDAQNVELGLVAAQAWFRSSESNEARLHRLSAYVARYDSEPHPSDADFAEDRQWFLDHHDRLSPQEQVEGWLLLASYAEFHRDLNEVDAHLEQAAKWIDACSAEFAVQWRRRRAWSAIGRLDPETAIQEASAAWKASKQCRAPLQRVTERELVAALWGGGRLAEAKAFLAGLQAGPDPHHELANLRLGMLIESDELDEARKYLETLPPPPFGFRARLRYLLYTGAFEEAEQFLEQHTPLNAPHRLAATMTRLAIQRERGDALGAAHAVSALLQLPRFSPGQRDLRSELILALKMGGGPGVDEQVEQFKGRLMPGQLEQWNTLHRPEAKGYAENLFFSKRWVDAKKLFAPR